MTKSIRLREYTTLMTRARRVSRSGNNGVCEISKQMLDELLETLDDLTGIDTSVPNKITVKVPR